MVLHRLLCLCFLCLAFVSCGAQEASDSQAQLPFADQRLEVFAGSASQPALELAVRDFESKSGARVDLHLGGSGAMLSRMELSGAGDIYLPGSSDYMEIAVERGLIHRPSQRTIAHLLPAILVQAGNPEGIQRLADLARPGLRIGIARPDTVCVGLYAVEVLESTGLADSMRSNVATHAESCAKTAQLVAMGQVEAVLGWRVFESWNPEAIEAIELAPGEVARIGQIPAAITQRSKDSELARAFLDHLTSPASQAHFRRFGYLTTLEEARALATEDTPVGGRWDLPESWKP